MPGIQSVLNKRECYSYLMPQRGLALNCQVSWENRPWGPPSVQHFGWAGQEAASILPTSEACLKESGGVMQVPLSQPDPVPSSCPP